MKKPKLFKAQVLLLAMLLPGVQIPVNSTPAQQNPEDTEVLKVFVWHLVRQSKAGTGDDVVYFVSESDSGKDTETLEGFVDELKKSGLRAKKYSELKIDDFGAKVQRDTTTHRMAVSLAIGNLEWINANEVSANGSYSYWKGRRRMDGGTYHLVRKKGAWVVTEFHRIRINSLY